MNLNPLELLRNDHVAVRGLLKDLEEMAPESSKAKVLALLRLIEREVKIHTTLEEQLFYPAFRKASAGEADRDLSMTAMRDHHAIDRLLPGLIVLAGNKGLFLPRLRAVRSLVTDHTEMEEQAMFARARELLSAAQLDALGRAITVRKERALQELDGDAYLSAASAQEPARRRRAARAQEGPARAQDARAGGRERRAGVTEERLTHRPKNPRPPTPAREGGLRRPGRRFQPAASHLARTADRAGNVSRITWCSPVSTESNRAVGPGVPPQHPAWRSARCRQAESSP
jgi:hemerythrin superfamily protein